MPSYVRPGIRKCAKNRALSIQTRPYDDFSQPLQLVARVLRFTDPITGEKREFVSRVPLKI